MGKGPVHPNPELFYVEKTGDGANLIRPKTLMTNNARVRAILETAPVLAGASLEGKDIEEFKENALAFLDSWSGHEKPSPAFNGEIVLAGRLTFEHVTEPKNSESNQIRRLKLIPRARTILEKVGHVECYRPDSEGGPTFSLVGRFADGQAVRVIVQKVRDEAKTFYSVFDIDDAGIKMPSAFGGEGLPTDSLDSEGGSVKGTLQLT